ncbi:MAG: glycosyltransferase family 4 protein [Proteobacteria bacterium]|nr:glycosyltransferase family 4 protein [Pseudomonadota bacterium]
MTAESAWVVAVRAALPSPRPQGWQAFQQAVGLAESGVPSVTLVGDAGLSEGVPDSMEAWLGRPLSEALTVVRPSRRFRPPTAGFLFRRSLRRLRDPSSTLLCRDARVAAAEGGRWRRVLLEWHVRPDPTNPTHAAALAAADLHITVAAGLAEDLRQAGVEPARVQVMPNACGLDRGRAQERAAAANQPNPPVLALGLHRRDGLELALEAWRRDPRLPALWIAGEDQDHERVGRWAASVERDPALKGRVRLVGAHWGPAREDLLDQAGAWLALYPRDDHTETRLCPLQAADAAGSGLPLVTTDLPSIRQLLGGRAARFVPPDDPDELASAVRSSLAEGRPPFVPRASWADRARSLRRTAEA